ncbi:Bug family tripartite tricarboxylate transporter substrate binding protein [Elioraea sp.]|uniref:Bug family tripartite tricarboxylate transporter substrate binding protein n=1 Tax=Elioraea sp. TaxID=2185103 RepID=UPI003F6F0690
MSRHPFRVAVVIGLFAGIAGAESASAQGMSTGPTRLVLGFPAGSNTDLLGRVLAEALRERLGSTVEVENRPGAAGVTALEAVARASPDGGTIGFAAPTLVTLRHVVKDLTFDPRTDLTPISVFAATPVVLTSAPGFPPRDLAALRESLRAAPGTRCGTPGKGSFLHLATVLLTNAMGVACEAVHYANLTQAFTDLQMGTIQLYMNLLPAALPMLRDGRARGLALASSSRHPLVPDVPVAAETIPGFELVGWFTLTAPRGLPEAVVRRLEGAAVAAARDPTVVAKLNALGAEAVGLNAVESAAKLKAEDERWGQVAQGLGLAAN